MSLSHQSSRIPRKARLVELEHGEYLGGIDSSTTSRITEIEASNRMRWGEQIAATNTAALLNKVDMLKCSTGHYAHFLMFAECKMYPWRHGGRQYYCRECMKKQRLEKQSIDAHDEQYLRSKKNNRRKRANL